jgi:nicotinamide riboside transporter PnuC
MDALFKNVYSDRTAAGAPYLDSCTIMLNIIARIASLYPIYILQTIKKEDTYHEFKG